MAYTGSTSEGSSNFAGNNSGNPLGYAGNSFGALKYNINSMLGWVFGKPSDNDVYIYSDIVFSNPDSQNFVNISNPNTVLFTYSNSTAFADQVLAKILSLTMSDGENVLQPHSLSISQYKTLYGKSDAMLGMTWLPWNVMGLSDGTNYNIKTYYDGGVVNVNPLRREVLWIKLFTFLKISGISLGSYALIKYSYKYIKKQN